MINNWDRACLAFFICVILMWIVLIVQAHSEEMTGHRPQDMEIHRQFYQDWMQPDHPWASCCHEKDCQPAASKFEDGHWWAKWEEMTTWVQIPDAKVERNRESPDGRSHMCGRHYEWDTGFTVFCFVRGGGV